MLVALDQTHDLAAGRHKLADLLNRVRTGHGFIHPVLPQYDLAQLGSPVLVYDLGTIGKRMRWISQQSRAISAIPLIAVKSSPDPEYLNLAYEHLGGFDVSNLAEYSALPHDLNGKLVSVTSPALSGDLTGFSTRGNATLVTLDSLVQLEYYFTQAPPIDYVLRVQGPDLLKDMEPPDAAYYPKTRFGFSLRELADVLHHPRLLENPPAGFHVHHGSERNQVSTYKEIIHGLSKLSRQLPRQPKYINLGGGWHALNEEGMTEVLREARQHFPPPCAILYEPGRWYADNAGFAIGTIVNQTHSDGIVRCTLDLSGKSHLHWSQARLLHTLEAGYKNGRPVQFYGPSCFEADYIGQYLVPYGDFFTRETGLRPGKQVIFSGISTYSAAWNTAFNGIPAADVIWLPS